MTVLEPPKERDPRCKGQCSGDRSATEPPTIMVQNRPACPCCGYFLTRAPAIEFGRPPNLNPEVANDTIRYEDNICRFDVVYVRSVKPA